MTERQGSVLANQQVRREYARISGEEDTEAETENTAVKRKPLREDDDCPICFDEMKEAEPRALLSVRQRVGPTFMHSAFRCGARRRSPRDSRTCRAACRQPWMDEATCGSKRKATAAAADGGSSEGYANLGQLQGQDAVRDSSTYSDYHGGWGYGGVGINSPRPRALLSAEDDFTGGER
jgi:hypothetical protein